MVNDTYSDIISNAVYSIYNFFTNIQYIYTVHTSQLQYGVLSALHDSPHRITCYEVLHCTSRLRPAYHATRAMSLTSPGPGVAARRRGSNWYDFFLTNFL